jgi:hypothetical protein
MPSSFSSSYVQRNKPGAFIEGTPEQNPKVNHFTIQFNSKRRKQSMRVAKFTKPLTVALEVEIYAEIQQITDRAQISMAQWIRDAIEFRLRDFIRIEGDNDEQ